MASTASSSLVAPTPPPENATYFPALDGVRALAFFLVFLAHYGDVDYVALGVNVFFVLSGFLITGILLDTRDKPHRVRNFYVRRTLRIFPLYYGVFLLIFALTPVFHWRWNSAWWLWPAYLGNYLMFMPEWLARPDWMRVSNGQIFGAHDLVLQLGHFWTLCFEEQFYLLWPWFVFTRSRKFLLWFCGVAVVISPVLRLIAAHTFPPAAIRAGVLFRTMPFQSDALLWGALLALLWRGQYRQAIVRYGRPASVAVIVATLLFFVLTVQMPLGWNPPLPLPRIPLTWHFTIADMVALALVICSLQPGTWLYHVFNLRPLRWIGRISYGAYVFHNIPHGVYYGLAFRISPNDARGVCALIGMFFSLVLAWASFRFFETPFLRLKEKWTIREGRAA